MDFLPDQFLDYIRPDADRADIIQGFLHDHGIQSHRIVMDGKNHILVQFDGRFYNSSFKIKTVIAHYDRVEGSPGANDNSAADWMIMNWALELAGMRTFHNVRILFTDGEELGWNTGVSGQGAFGIASVFKRLGITGDDIFVFDACGRGDVAVLSKTVLPPKAPRKFALSFSDLFGRAQDLLRRSCPGRWMTLPVPYSDNASFLACGIPAVALTMLPSDEASLYAKELMNDGNLEPAVMNRESTKAERMKNPGADAYYKSKMPLTWRLFHSENDNAGSLTPESFRIMSNILHNLAQMRTPFF